MTLPQFEKHFSNFSSVFLLIAFNRFYLSFRNIFDNCFPRSNFRFQQKLTRLCTHEVEVEIEEGRGARWVCKKVSCLLVCVAPHTKPHPAQFTLLRLPQIYQAISGTHRTVPSTGPPIRLSVCCAVLSYIASVPPTDEMRPNIREFATSAGVP